VAGQQVYRVGDPGVVAPQPIHREQAHYTPAALQRGVEGAVVMELTVLEEGSMSDVRVTEALDDDLDAQAVAAVKEWTFRPGTKDGQAVPVRVAVSMTFTLK
jgi:protein TonB